MTEPPGELMYSVMALSGASDSRKSNCATMAAESVSLTSPFRQTMRSYIRVSATSSVFGDAFTCKSFENMSAVLGG